MYVLTTASVWLNCGYILVREVLRHAFGLEIMIEDIAMRITLELPEEIVQQLKTKWEDLPRVALESLALEAYRSHALTTAQLRRLLGFETRMEVDAFLKKHEVYDFTAADFEQDR